MCIQPEDSNELYLVGQLWPPIEEEDHPGGAHDSDENNESSEESSEAGEALLMQGADEQDREMEESKLGTVNAGGVKANATSEEGRKEETPRTTPPHPRCCKAKR